MQMYRKECDMNGLDQEKVHPRESIYMTIFPFICVWERESHQCFYLWIVGETEGDPTVKDRNHWAASATRSDHERWFCCWRCNSSPWRSPCRCYRSEIWPLDRRSMFLQSNCRISLVSSSHPVVIQSHFFCLREEKERLRFGSFWKWRRWEQRKRRRGERGWGRR